MTNFFFFFCVLGGIEGGPHDLNFGGGGGGGIQINEVGAIRALRNNTSRILGGSGTGDEDDQQYR